MTPFVLWLSRLSSFAATPAVWGVFFAGAVIYLIAEWRIRLLALLGQYFALGILFAHLFDTRPELALLKTLVGWLVCGALFLSARTREEATAGALHLHWAADLPFRIITLTVMVLVAYLATQRYPLPFLTTDLSAACFLLLVLAVLFIGTDGDAGVAGLGVLNLLSGLDLFYSAWDPGLLVTGLMVVVTLLAGLAISYLTVAEVAE